MYCIALDVHKRVIIEFQNKVAQTNNELTVTRCVDRCNRPMGSVSCSGKRFRDPTTGSTFQLSNKFDRAWLNGTIQYVMSDDPNFSPNGNLRGDWTPLHVVQRQPEPHRLHHHSPTVRLCICYARRFGGWYT